MPTWEDVCNESTQACNIPEGQGGQLGGTHGLHHHSCLCLQLCLLGHLAMGLAQLHSRTWNTYQLGYSTEDRLHVHHMCFA